MVKRIAQGFARPKVVLATVGVALVAAPGAAFAVGEGKPVDGGERNPSANGSQSYRGETEIIADNGTYGTRQSNKSTNGGGAIYGCRAVPGARPCLRSNNLNKGLAFQLVSSGTLVGQIMTAAGGDGSKPFTTNATGVATGLNADRVDGLDAAEIATKGDLKFAAVGADGALGNKRGAAAVGRDLATNSYTVTFDADVSKCSFTASPNGAASDESLAVQSASDPKAVRVDADGPTAFHLQVVC